MDLNSDIYTEWYYFIVINLVLSEKKMV